jgi:Sugar kinases, ribokinase family
MKVLVFGSANIDRTYSVEHFVRAGETLSADKMDLHCGGKGFNQAIAFARAGSDVYFAGAIGEDGGMLYDALKESGVNVDHLKRIPGPSGHAVIQVTPDGQNSIIILAGSNGAITHEDVDQVLNAFSSGDLVVLQNEISSVDYIIDQAKEVGMIVALNPSPFNERIKIYDLSKIDYLLVNEVEGALLTGCDDQEKMAGLIHAKYPDANVVLTLGCAGSVFAGKDGNVLTSGIYETNAVDTTAAGDTYTGFFLSEALTTGDIETALKNAAIASGISVSRPGASQSIPSIREVREADERKVTAFSMSICKEDKT